MAPFGTVCHFRRLISFVTSRPSQSATLLLRGSANCAARSCWSRSEILVGEFYGTDLGAVFVVQFKHEFRSLARFVPKKNRIRNRCLTYGKRTAVRSVCTPMTHKLRRSSRKAWSHGWKNSTVGAITCFSHPSVCHTCDCALLVAQPDDASRLCGHQPSGRSERGGVRL